MSHFVYTGCPLKRERGACFGRNLNLRSAIIIWPKVNRYEDCGILRSRVADGILVSVTCISLILLHLNYIFNISINNNEIF